MEQIIQVLFSALASILAILASFAINALKKWLLANTSKKDQEYLKMASELAVKYVEQKGYLEDGETKFDMALDSVSEFLETKGINFTTEEMKVAIESAVYEVNQPKRKLELEQEKQPMELEVKSVE